MSTPDLLQYGLLVKQQNFKKVTYSGVGDRIETDQSEVQLWKRRKKR